VEVDAVVAVDVEVINMKNIPSRLTFQWHITDNCNLRCRHCYQSDYQDSGLSLIDNYLILDKIVSFVTKLKESNNNLTAQINITGGEPFVKEDIIDLLKRIRSYNDLQFAILSNGMQLPDDELKELAMLKPKFIQLSLEGDKSTNDNIRGQGSYDQVKKALVAYRKMKIPVMISFTANSQNYKQFKNVVKFARKYGAYKVWTDRYLPINKHDELLLSNNQTKEFFQDILKIQERESLRLIRKIQVSSNRALQFLVAGGLPYKCSAGKSLLAILPNGDLLPCRRLPIKIGNLLTDNLSNIYFESKILNCLRDDNALNDQCMNCYYKNSCNGGLKCLSYAFEGDFNAKDPNCWI